MNVENVSSVVATLSGGFFVSFLIGYFIKKIIKILMFIFGGVLALLMYLQSQGMISVEVDTDKIQSSVEAILNTIVTFPLFVPMVCRNICERIYSKIVVGESHYLVGKKYCRRCECYFITKNIFCQCCGMQLRGSPAERECKEKLNGKIKKRKRKLRLGIVLKPNYLPA